MKTLRVALVAALVAGCHFDKLFNSAPGGSHAPPPGSSSTRLAFTVPPTDAMKDSTIQPPVQVTVFDSAGNEIGRASWRDSGEGAVGGGSVGGRWGCSWRVGE